jgi:hypothetical protein
MATHDATPILYGFGALSQARVLGGCEFYLEDRTQCGKTVVETLVFVNENLGEIPCCAECLERYRVGSML